MTGAGFDGLRVLALESRHAKEISKLIASYGGQPTVAPAMREVSLESPEALEFAAELVAGKFDMVIFLTGAGTRALVAAVEDTYPREQLSAALQRVQVVARGPKPVSALRELGVKPSLIAPEPNTWRELLRVLDDAGASQSVKGLQIAVQELHKCGAVYRQTVPVHELFRGKTVWQGDVEVFDLADHPKASRVYAWSHETDDPSNPRRHVTVLHIPPATTPLRAVQVSIANDVREAQANAEG